MTTYASKTNKIDLLQDALEVRDLDLTLKDDEGEGGGKPLAEWQKTTANHPLLNYFLNLRYLTTLFTLTSAATVPYL